MIYKIFRTISLIALLCFTTNLISAQPHLRLTEADFLGTPKPNGRGVVAYTNCTIDFKFQASRRGGDYLLHFNVRLFMNKDRSWIDRSRIVNASQMAEILKHEQGHYTIAYLEQQEVLRIMSQTRFSANYQAEAMNIFNSIDNKYKQLNRDYDEDTAHMVNRQQQHSWDIYFAKRLQFMPQESASL
ncbi:hypothetical protein ACFQZX_18095 [Mucilaginibacter litoreus]|uniref:DUF922 domain-containing protein n=1 Tax=Mucilaginibacter litoreus TaxID=1048221 RepID=A0ABW3AYR4_9SPHI